MLFKQKSAPGAFTLVELVAVLAIMVLLMVFIAPAFTGIQGGQNVRAASDNIAGLLNQARSYAMSNNTHVFVGFEEVDVSNASTVNTQASGTGRVAVAVVASSSGISNYTTSPSIAGSWTSGYSNGALLTAIYKLQHFDNIHMSATAFPSTGNMQRPVASYQVGSGGFQSSTPFAWPLGNAYGAGNYNFVQVIEFDPQGVAWYQSASNSNAMAQYFEIGLQKTNGNAVSSGSDIAAIQIDGMTGATRIYRP